MSEDRFIETDGATLEVREDGKGGVYSTNGFQIVEIEELPEHLAKLVKEFQS